MKPNREPDVAATLASMVGVWHDRIILRHLDGTPLDDDTEAGSGTPGASPFENLVYIGFDGDRFDLTNVHLRGRSVSAKTFRGAMRDGLMVFDSLGPGAFENVGVSGGPGILTFNALRLDAACCVYMEPDFIILTGPDARVRHTVLYRDGVAVRTLTAHGTRLSTHADRRHPMDPRGTTGPVHGDTFSSPIWSHLVEDRP
jgi:hypothetical protein